MCEEEREAKNPRVSGQEVRSWYWATCSWIFKEVFLKFQDCSSVPIISWRRDWRLAPEYRPNCSCGSPAEEGHKSVDFLELRFSKQP